MKKKRDKMMNNGFDKADDKWAFIRHFMAAHAQVGVAGRRVILNGPTDLLQAIAAFAGIPHELVHDNNLVYRDMGAIDFLGEAFRGVADSTHPHYNDYLALTGCEGVCLVQKACPDAVLPQKARATDAGYDLSVIRKVKDLNRVVALYDTGIRVRAPHGFYTEVVPRSSLSKSGYMLANSIGVIDRSYNGNIYVALAKIDDEAPDIQFPFRCCQLLFRRQHNLLLQESADGWDDTARGAGGFGSTGN